MMISHELGNTYFNLRTCGIAIDKDRVLVVKISPYDFWLFPGGRIEYLESSEAALEREIKEELKMDCRVVRLLWLVEDFYTFEGQKTHELCYYYLIDFPKNKEIYEKEEWIVNEEEKSNERVKTLTFQWIPLSRIDKIELIPHYIKVRLGLLPQEINLLVLDHINKESKE